MLCKIDEKDGVYYIRKAIDESFPVGAIRPNENPIILDFKDVRVINSIGVQKFVEFTESWHGRQVLYRRISTPVLDAILMIPAMLGPEENSALIESMFVPYRAPATDETHEFLIQASELRMENAVLLFPTKTNQNQISFEAEDSASDIELLVECGSLRISKPA